MWSDNETHVDLVGFRVHADSIRAVVTDTTLLPVTIGLFGDWGGGKSSIMKMLAQDLDPEDSDSRATPEQKDEYKHVACLYFNGWLFEGYDDAKSAILSTILKELAHHKRFGPKVKDKAHELLRSVDWMRAAKLGLTKIILPVAIAHFAGGTSLLPAVAGAAGKLFHVKKRHKDADDGGKAEKKKSDADEENKDDDSPLKGLIRKGAEANDPQDVRTFRAQFQKLLEDSDIGTLVVIIDDLDRCSPQRIVENLEAIKLFLNVERTAFVIGADPRIVRHAVAMHYRTGDYQVSVSDTEDAEQLVRDYLEKVIQIPYHLPKLSPSETETYMSLLFCQREIKDETVLGKVLDACERQRESDRYRSFGMAAIKTAAEGAELPTALESGLAFTLEAAPLINEGLKGNPRQVKRFMNAYVLRKKLATVAKLHHVRDEVLVKLMILEYGNPDRFRDLYEWQARQDGHPEELRVLEVAARSDGTTTWSPPQEKWATASLRKWLAMDPRLADVDLRNYFWLARDKMDSTLGGMSLISPVVQNLSNALLSRISGERLAAIQGVAALDGDDRITLLGLLESHILRNPDQLEGYTAMATLIEADVTGSAESLARALLAADVSRIPPGLAFQLATMMKARPGVAAVLTPVLEQLQKSHNSPFARALKQATSQVQGGRR